MNSQTWSRCAFFLLFAFCLVPTLSAADFCILCVGGDPCPVCANGSNGGQTCWTPSCGCQTGGTCSGSGDLQLSPNDMPPDLKLGINPETLREVAKIDSRVAVVLGTLGMGDTLRGGRSRLYLPSVTLSTKDFEDYDQSSRSFTKLLTRKARRVEGRPLKVYSIEVLFIPDSHDAMLTIKGLSARATNSTFVATLLATEGAESDTHWTIQEWMFN